MAEQEGMSGGSHTFDKGLQQNISNFYEPKNTWPYSRNAINNSATGDLGELGNEPGNNLCGVAPYTIIGAIHLFADTWAIFSTDRETDLLPISNSEIGIWQEDICQYKTVINDSCLSFAQSNLITGSSKENSDCTFQIYWQDALNPDRTMCLGDPKDWSSATAPQWPCVPYIQICTDENGVVIPSPNPEYTPFGCVTCENTTALDCDAIRLARLVKPACLRIEKGQYGGEILNGSYYVVMAYLVDGEKFTDYSTPSNIQPIFNHENVAASLDIYVDSIDELHFDEFELVLITNINQQISAKKVGVYSVYQRKITLDAIDNRWPSVPIENIPIRTAVVDRSDLMTDNGTYLLRAGTYNKFDFNYQPLANKIKAKWQSVEYPADYYKKGGNKTGYMRDEVYCFWIRWVYDTGDKSPSFHIPGRPAQQFTPPYSPTATYQEDAIYNVPTSTDPDNIEFDPTVGASSFPQVFEVFNTATVTTAVPSSQWITNPIDTLEDGGRVIAEGDMGYWESEEQYPNNPTIWNSDNSTPASPWDLCSKKIRHHKFPEDSIGLNRIAIQRHRDGGKYIRIMGVRFDNIVVPVDQSGIPISGIVGYEILRGTREGNRSVIAKGMINNLGQYELPDTNQIGLYPNYPYNDLSSDPFLSNIQTSTYTGFGTQNQLNAYPKNFFTFHSPDTQFKNPFLSMKEMKIYGELICGYQPSPSALDGATFPGVEGQFEVPEEHPKHKLPTDLLWWISLILGFGAAVISMNGKRRNTKQGIEYSNLETTYSADASVPPAITTTSVAGTGGVFGMALYDFGIIGTGGLNSFAYGDAILGLGNLVGFDTGMYDVADQLLSLGFSLVSGTNGGGRGVDFENTPWTDTATFFQGLTTPTSGGPFITKLAEAADTILEAVLAFSTYQQYALTYRSHAFYNTFSYPNRQAHQTRRAITDSIYLDPHFQTFAQNYVINNLYRQRAVALKINGTLNDPFAPDNSKITVGQAVNTAHPSGVGNFINAPSAVSYLPPIFNFDPPGTKVYDLDSVTKPFNGTVAASHYVGLKQRIRNQYGQLDGVMQVPTGTCVFTPGSTTNPFSSPVIFGGDVYIGRYTEKNTMPFFYDWLYGQDDGYEYNYNGKKNVLYPTYWMNSIKTDIYNFFQSVIDQAIGAAASIAGLSSTVSQPFSSSGWELPSSKRKLDGGADIGRMVLKNCYFYLFNSGVRDFFVESEINIDLRDWGELPEQRHYDFYNGYVNLKDLFNVKYITSGNYYKYDFSLSISRLYNNFVSWGNMQTRDYDPNVSQKCYAYRPNTIIYSQPTTWDIFLPNNYKNYTSRPTGIKTVNKNGIMIFFETESPIQYQGVDTLQTGLNTKITIGDGGLFSQPRQATNNVEIPYEYASCQNYRAVMNTPAGLFWVSANQGKIYSLGGAGAMEISGQDMKWWFAKYLPFKILEDFPEFELTDNTVIGVGCQTIFNNQDSLLYFNKIDYKVKEEYSKRITYLTNNSFILDNQFQIKLGDPRYFDDASWTISYDPKTRAWLSFHDWHPELLLPGKKTFMSTMTDLANGQGGIWVHNQRSDLYCNYYEKDYPFEVEFRVHTGQSVQTLRSIEYIMEVYKYADNETDRYHFLDFNFDEAVIYNTEQVSGLLNLKLNPKNNPLEMVGYPKVNLSSIDIIYSKVENKYRFDQFWDITDDRGEYSNAQRMIWNTEPNGYVKTLNPLNLNYQKNPFQRKKFRHYMVTVLLRRKISGNKKMLVMIQNVKNQNSPR